MARKQRLELTWIGKDKREKLEPRVLIEDEAMSYSAAVSAGFSGLRDNFLIKGDNLLALKALEAQYSGIVKCCYIDPPYNTGSALFNYEDGLEHSIWLSLIRDRLAILKNLLSVDGSIWISIDDDECHYLKVLCDEVFGRENFVANVIWQKRFSPNNTAQFLSDSHDHILVYAKDKSKWKINLLPREEVHNKNYSNPDNDPRGPWTSGDLSARNPYSEGIYPIATPSGRIIDGPPKGMYWRVSKRRFEELDNDNRIWWGKAGGNVPRLKRFLSEIMTGIVPQTIWQHTEVGNTQEAKKEVMRVVDGAAEVFQTAKPERLISRVLQLASAPGDLVLDSFAGSGTTGAVAHKMGRRWIMVELHDHADTHIVPRLKKVIDGEDPGGVTEATGWQGGGGFRYYRLAPSLLQKDKWGQFVISKEFKPEMLAEAVAKLMGFTYAPSQEHFWQHGHATERDFIYVTTQRLTADSLKKLSHEVGEGRTLLVCCRAFEKHTPFDNLTVKKIPQAVMNKCEWGRDDYSLNIQEAPPEPITEADLADTDETEDAEAAE